MQNTNVYKIQSYAVFSGFTNSIIISLCLIKSSNQMCDGRTDRRVHPSISTPLEATRVFYFFYSFSLYITIQSYFRGPGGSMT